MVQKPTVLLYLSQSLLRWPLVNIYCNNFLKLLLKLEVICLKAWTCTWKAQYNEKFLKWNNFWYCFLWSSHLGFALPWIFFFASPSQPAGEGNGHPLQYSCLENPTDGGARWAAVHAVAKSWTRLSDFTFTFHFCRGPAPADPGYSKERWHWRPIYLNIHQRYKE